VKPRGPDRAFSTVSTLRSPAAHRRNHRRVVEDIDTGLHRLTDNLAKYCVGLDPQHVADTLLTHLGVSHGAHDDIAVVVVRL
jgi:hypothetical protein